MSCNISDKIKKQINCQASYQLKYLLTTSDQDIKVILIRTIKLG